MSFEWKFSGLDIKKRRHAVDSKRQKNSFLMVIGILVGYETKKHPRRAFHLRECINVSTPKAWEIILRS